MTSLARTFPPPPLPVSPRKRPFAPPSIRRSSRTKRDLLSYSDDRIPRGTYGFGSCALSASSRWPWHRAFPVVRRRRHHRGFHPPPSSHGSSRGLLLCNVNSIGILGVDWGIQFYTALERRRSGLLFVSPWTLCVGSVAVAAGFMRGWPIASVILPLPVQSTTTAASYPCAPPSFRDPPPSSHPGSGGGRRRDDESRPPSSDTLFPFHDRRVTVLFRCGAHSRIFPRYRLRGVGRGLDLGTVTGSRRRSVGPRWGVFGFSFVTHPVGVSPRGRPIHGNSLHGCQ